MIKDNINYYERKEVIKRNIDEARSKLFNSIPKLSLFHLNNIEYKNEEIKEGKQVEGVKKKTKLLDKTKLNKKKNNVQKNEKDIKYFITNNNKCTVLNKTINRYNPDNTQNKVKKKMALTCMDIDNSTIEKKTNLFDNICLVKINKIQNNEPMDVYKKEYTTHQKCNKEISRQNKDGIKNIYSNNKYSDLPKLRKNVLDKLNNADKKNDQLFTLSLNVKNNKKSKLNYIDTKEKNYNNKSQSHIDKPNVTRTNKGVVKINKINKTDRLYSDNNNNNNNVGIKKNGKISCTCDRERSKMLNQFCSEKNNKSNKENKHLASCDIKGKKKKKIIIKKNIVVSGKEYLKKNNLKIMPKEVKSIKKETDRKFSLQKLTHCSKNKSANINEKKKEKKIRNDALCHSIKNKRNELVTQLRNKTMSIKYSMEEKAYKPIRIVSNITTKLNNDIYDEENISNKKKIQKTSKICLGWKRDDKNMGIFSYSSETEQIEETHRNRNEKIDRTIKDELLINVDNELRDKKMNSENFLWEKNSVPNKYVNKKYINEEENNSINNNNNILKKKRSKSLNSINEISPFNSILVTNDLRIKMCYSNNYIDIKKAIHDDNIKNKDRNKKMSISINNYNILNSSDDLFLISMDSEKTKSSYTLPKKKNSHTSINNTSNLPLNHNSNNEEKKNDIELGNNLSNNLLFKTDLCICDNNIICKYCSYKIQNKLTYNRQLFSSIKLTNTNKIEVWDDEIMDSIFYPENKMGNEKMGSEKMESEKMESEKMESEKMGSEKMESEKMRNEKMESEKMDGKISAYSYSDHKNELFEFNKNIPSYCNALTESNIFIFDIINENCSKKFNIESIKLVKRENCYPENNSKFVEKNYNCNNTRSDEIQGLKRKETNNLNKKNMNFYKNIFPSSEQNDSATEMNNFVDNDDNKYNEYEKKHIKIKIGKNVTKAKKVTDIITLKKTKAKHKEVLTNNNEPSKSKDKKKKIKTICTNKNYEDENKNQEIIVKSKNGCITNLSRDTNSRTKKKEKKRTKKQNSNNNNNINKYGNNLIMCHLKKEGKIRKNENNLLNISKENTKNKSISLNGKKREIKDNIDKIELKEKILTNKISEKCIDSLMAYRCNLLKEVQEEENKISTKHICEFHHSNINFKDDKKNQINKMSILKLLISDQNKKGYIRIEKENKIIKKLNTSLCVKKKKKTKNGRINKNNYHSTRANTILKRKSKMKSLLVNKKKNRSNIKSISMIINGNLDNFMNEIGYVSNCNNNGKSHTFENGENGEKNKTKNSKIVQRTNLWEEIHMPICGENYIEVLPDDQKYLCLNAEKKEIKYSVYTKKYIKKKYNQKKYNKKKYNKKKWSIKMKILYKRFLYQTKDNTFLKISQKLNSPEILTKNNLIFYNCDDEKKRYIQNEAETGTQLNNKMCDQNCVKGDYVKDDCVKGDYVKSDYVKYDYVKGDYVKENSGVTGDTEKDASMIKKKKKKKKKLALDYGNDKGKSENITHEVKKKNKEKNKKTKCNNIVTKCNNIVTTQKNETNFTKNKKPLNKFNKTSYSSENVIKLVKPSKRDIQSADIYSHKYESNNQTKLIKMKMSQNEASTIKGSQNEASTIKGPQNEASKINGSQNEASKINGSQNEASKINYTELNNNIIDEDDDDINKISGENDQDITKNKIELNFCFEDFLSSSLKQKLNHSNSSTNVSSNSDNMKKLKYEFSLDLEKYVLNHPINQISLKKKLKNVESKFVEKKCKDRESENVNETGYVKFCECEIINKNNNGSAKMNMGKIEEKKKKNDNSFKIIKAMDKDKLFCSNPFYRNHIINDKNEMKNKMFMKTINIKEKISNKIQEIKKKNTSLFRAFSMNNVYKTIFSKDPILPTFENYNTTKNKQKTNSNYMNNRKCNSYELIKTKSLVYKKNGQEKCSGGNRLKIEDFLNNFDKKRNSKNGYIPTNGYIYNNSSSNNGSSNGNNNGYNNGYNNGKNNGSNGSSNKKIFFKRSKSAILFKRNNSKKIYEKKKNILQNFDKESQYGKNCTNKEIDTNVKKNEKTIKKCVSMVNEYFIKNNLPVNKSLINNSTIYKNNFFSTPCFMFESTLKKNTSFPIERH
ncbi:hypothetical protein YYC_00897 [Plasmodium yoelii 17X]|uniref:Uncharacterized protein n=3 Tax=Plasmodium yoelii TaxID=5861 RepID=A0AAE9WSM5_PLAYO|nr:hypothetical protein YYC_00897 [Plasmodium yoelii 17X]WBY59306.1 hypothetical protein Py17XNL_001205149 [Plasmodium yoelii yoelii]CDU19457.1 conserved Plasmodium protein, unknown function [Plasmodium yoelii]